MASYYWPTLVAGSVGPGAFPLLAPDGSVGAPSYSFSSESNSGIYRPSAGAIAVSILGSNVFQFNAGSIQGLQPYSGSTLGVTDGSAAASGIVGEVKTAKLLRSAASALTTDTRLNIVSLLIPAGDWNLYAMGGLSVNSSTAITRVDLGISTTSVTFSGADTIASQDANGQIRSLMGYPAAYVPGVDMAFTGLFSNISISTPTTYYLVAQVAFSVSTAAAYGSLICKRAR